MGKFPNPIIRPRTVVVCGSRKLNNRKLAYSYLDFFHKTLNIEILIHGDYEGADHIARDWAIKNGISQFPIPANWKKHKGAAGPIRNSKMIYILTEVRDKEGKEVAVIAFPGGNGTNDTISKAKKAGILLIELNENHGEFII